MKTWVNCELSVSETNRFKLWLYDTFGIKPEVSYVLPDLRHLEIPVVGDKESFIRVCNDFIDTL